MPARCGTWFEASESLRHGVRQYFGAIGKHTARGLAVRHEHGSQYMPDSFQTEMRSLGIRARQHLSVHLKATAAPSGLCGPSRRTCHAFEPSTPSRNPSPLCARSTTSTTRLGLSSGSTPQPPHRSGSTSSQPMQSPHKLLSDVPSIRRRYMPDVPLRTVSIYRDSGEACIVEKV